MQIATKDVELSAPISNALYIATANKSQNDKTFNTIERLARQSAGAHLSLKKIPFQVINGSPLALSEARAPSEIGQHLNEGRAIFLPRPVFRGQDLSLTITNAGRSVDFHGANPFRITSDALAILSKRTRLYKQFQEGDTVRLACRYLRDQGMGQRLDIFQDVLLREGRVLLNEPVSTDIGETINCRSFVLNTGTSDPTEIFERETRKVLAEVARGNPELRADVEAVLWFPRNHYFKDAIKTVRVDVSPADRAAFK